MSEFSRELVTQEKGLVHALGKKSKFTAMVVAIFGLNAGVAHEGERTHFPTTLGLEERSHGRMNPIKAPIVSETNDDCVRDELTHPDELITT